MQELPNIRKLEAIPRAHVPANFIRPGSTVKIVSAGIAAGGTITVSVNLAESQGVPLDRAVINTPGTGLCLNR
jgi:hypothetical protein